MTKLYVRYYGSQSNAYLMRLHNMKEFNSTLFPGQYKSLKETTLTANQLLEEWENNRMTWKGENGKSFEHSSSNFKNEKIEDIKEKINERSNYLLNYNANLNSFYYYYIIING